MTASLPLPPESVYLALEAERRRIADLLNTQLVGQINLISAQIRVYEQTAASQNRLNFTVLASLTNQLLQITRDLENSLHPTALETLGLEAALEALAGQIRRTSGAGLELYLPYSHERLPTVTESVLFRTTQALIDDALHHQATVLTLHLERSETSARYQFKDNGTQRETQHMLVKSQVEMLDGQWRSGITQPGGHFVEIYFELAVPADLTEREMDVICLLADGLSNKEIAQQLGVRPRTVKFHLDNIYSKLGVNSRTEAAVYAVRQGWAGSA